MKSHLSRHVVQTGDGSSSLFIPEMNEHYHSHRGALTESIHVFIENGLKRLTIKNPTILEIGLGTGLNALLTAGFINDSAIYHALEPYPLSEDEWTKLVFKHDKIKPNWISDLHSSSPGKRIQLGQLDITWYLSKLEDFASDYSYDLVYFDAFAPSKQASPWSESNLQKVFDMMNDNGLLVTYCANGAFKRILKSLGMDVLSPPGPLGKREMTVARKIRV